MAVLEGGEPTVIENSEGGRSTPSVVAFTQSGERLVGTVAKRQAPANPTNTVFSITRLVGVNAADIGAEVFPFKVVSGPNGNACVEAGGKQYSPPEISAMILQKLKADAEAYLGETVDRAVITVPAYFNDDQRQATKDAGRIAGLDVKRIINEPTAASLAYGLHKGQRRNVVVFKLGRNTFDVSLIEIAHGTFRLRATRSDSHLGSESFNEAIVDWLAAQFKHDQGIDLTQDKMALQRLYEAAEKAKIELSSAQETQINLPFITADPSGPKHLDVRLARDKLEELQTPLIERALIAAKTTVRDASTSNGSGATGLTQIVDHLVFVGGSVGIDVIHEALTDAFAPCDVHCRLNSEYALALGALVAAHERVVEIRAPQSPGRYTGVSGAARTSLNTRTINMPRGDDAMTWIKDAYAHRELTRPSVEVLAAVADAREEISQASGEGSSAAQILLATIVVDDTRSITFDNGPLAAVAVRNGHNRCVAALTQASGATEVLVQTRFLNKGLIAPYTRGTRALMLDATSYSADGGDTPLYRQSVIALGSAVTKARQLRSHGAAVRTFTLIITDGADNASGAITAKHVACLVGDMQEFSNNHHLIVGMGIGADAKFRPIFTEMGLNDNCILTSEATREELLATFRSLAQKLLLAAGSEQAFVRLQEGGVSD
jgi:molecular chaperone DnaK (HSP70)